MFRTPFCCFINILPGFELDLATSAEIRHYWKHKLPVTELGMHADTLSRHNHTVIQPGYKLRFPNYWQVIDEAASERADSLKRGIERSDV